MKDLNSFVFILAVFIITLFIWYVTIFRDGAQKMRDAIIGMNGEKYSYFAKIVILKIFITIMLLLVMYGLYLATEKIL